MCATDNLKNCITVLVKFYLPQKLEEAVTCRMVPRKNDRQTDVRVKTQTHVLCTRALDTRENERGRAMTHARSWITKESPTTLFCSSLLLVPLCSKPPGSGPISGDHFHF